MATTWVPMTRMEPQEFLLGDGTIIKEPPLEMSGSGRKVRVAGTTTSVFMNEIDELIGRAAKDVAVANGTHVWMQTDVAQRLRGVFDWTTANNKLHLVHDPTNTSGMTDLWWRFKDVNTPFEVVLWVRMQSASRGAGATAQNIWTSMVLPGRAYYGEHAPKVTFRVMDKTYADYIQGLHYLDSSLPSKWWDFLRDNPAGWGEDLMSANAHAHSRAGVAALLKIVRQFDSLDEIQVPNLGDPFNPSYLTLALHDSNVNAELISDMTEYLDGAPTIEQAAELYQQMLDTLRSVGITINAKSHNDFLAAMLVGDKASLNMQVYNLAEQSHAVDHDHKLSVHLPTGTFVVECTHTEVDKNVVAEKWEEALTMASLTGQEDELLAYARRYAAEHNQRRTEKILEERRVV